MKKRIIIILVVLCIIISLVLFLPDSFYIKYSKYGKTSEYFKNLSTGKEEKKSTIEDMFKNLSNQKYDYKYSLKNISYTYECTGNKNKEKEQGTCTLPEEKEYNETNFNEVYNNINIKYLDTNYIYELIKDIDGKNISYDETRQFEYEVVSNNTNTNIIIYANKDNIYKINIVNKYLTYNLEYSNITIDN